MPFINNKITVPVPQEKREALNAGYDEAIGLFGKTEEWVMVHVEDESELYFGGKKLEKGAYVDVNLMGDIEDGAVLEYTRRTCELLEAELGIPGENVYVAFHNIPASHWGLEWPDVLGGPDSFQTRLRV